jgi:hypothetical protein
MMKHDTFCGITGEYFTSECEPTCDYYKEAVKECIAIGEHLRMTTIDPKHGDVCFNCGTNA